MIDSKAVRWAIENKVVAKIDGPIIQSVMQTEEAINFNAPDATYSMYTESANHLVLY
jgi:hypothetical protein